MRVPFFILGLCRLPSIKAPSLFPAPHISIVMAPPFVLPSHPALKSTSLPFFASVYNLPFSFLSPFGRVE